MQSDNRNKQLATICVAGIIGFLVPSIFSMYLRWPRAIYLIPYTIIIGSFIVIYVKQNSISFKQMIGPWFKGLIAVILACSFILFKMKNQPSSFVPEGIRLVGSIFWLGIVYGALDGIFLNVIPVLCIYKVWPIKNKSTISKTITRGILALFASLFVTAAYHFGYPEYQNSTIVAVLIGNTIITLTYILTGSPIAAILTHIVMHIGAVLHGMETTVQLPPHYGM